MIQNLHGLSPEIKELSLAVSMTKTTLEEIANSVADIVASRLIGIIPDKSEIEQSVTGEKPLRGVRALCSHYGMSTATLDKMLKAGKIPFRKVGNRYLFYVSEVDNALKGGGYYE